MKKKSIPYQHKRIINAEKLFERRRTQTHARGYSEDYACGSCTDNDCRYCRYTGLNPAA